MKMIKTCVFLFGIWICAALTTGRAEIAAGSYTNTFSDLNLWDISGSYDESVDDISVSYTLNMDAAGKLTGDGTFDYDVGWGDSLSGDFTVSGAVKSSGAAVRITFTMLMSGSGTLTLEDQWGTPSDYYVVFTAKATEKLELDSATREMIGTMGGSVKVAIPSIGRKGGASIPKTYQSLVLPDDVDGQWTLSMNVIPVGTKYTGTATIDLSNGKSFDLGVTGSYTAKKDISKIALKNLATKSMSLSLVSCCTNLQMNVQSLKGSALGQKLKTVY